MIEVPLPPDRPASSLSTKTEPWISSFDSRPGWYAIRDQIIEAIDRVQESGQLILGSEVKAFEVEFADLVQAAHAIGTSSGTESIVLALRALNIGPGDEVITVANGPVPTTSAIRSVGAQPIYVDIDPRTLQIDPNRIEAALSQRTRCIVPIHLYGLPAPIAEIAEICRHNSLYLVEDCAQALGTYVNERHVGTYGQIGCFSFYPTKNLGAYGDAGMCVTADEQIAARIREQACYGFRNDRIAWSEGVNGRLDELQAAILRVKMIGLPQAILRRAQIANVYRTCLEELNLFAPRLSNSAKIGWHQCVVCVQERDAWMKFFHDNRIQTSIHYAHPVHLMPAYVSFGYREGDLVHTENACQRVLSLPLYPELTDQQVTRVCNVLRQGVAAGLK